MRLVSRIAGLSALCATVLPAAAALAGPINAAPAIDLWARVAAVPQSGEFIAGFLAGLVLMHLVHLSVGAARRMLTMTFFLSSRLAHYGIAAAVLGGLVYFV